MTDDISKQLQELEVLREQLRAQREKAEKEIANIDDKLDNLKVRQLERMHNDDRVDNTIVETLKNSEDRVRTENIYDDNGQRTSGVKEDNRRLIQRELSEEDVRVQIKETATTKEKNKGKGRGKNHQP